MTKFAERMMRYCRQSIACSVVAVAVMLVLLSACAEERKPSIGVFGKENGQQTPMFCDLPDIQAGGELIVLTMYGPESYFEFRGQPFGAQYRVADAYARSIGVSMRVELCRSREEMVDRLMKGDGDIIAWQLALDDSTAVGVQRCGANGVTHLMDTLSVVMHEPSRQRGKEVAWAVRPESEMLAESLEGWMAAHRDELLAMSMPPVRSMSVRNPYVRPTRRGGTVAAPMLNAAHGEISVYDNLFKAAAPRCGWDWRLLAAQAYEESAFNPNAVSWAGAVGLMQIMPSTGRQLGLSSSDLYIPERSVNGAVRLISQLNAHYADVRDPAQRICFVLAAYNAGPGHVDDARRLAAKHGRANDRWDGNVAEFALKMSEPQYYNDDVVRHGYFRGSETYNYVADIMSRWQKYRK